ncbi:hypothetical protein QAD02_015060 [Eretmocerus hayati]|uniref:Uncharacterized protein n=1 Tax=Eretmocerus hayati TaxID=131215 RepID=A0ACC2P849_9HYME|nr:hypothetical protein QAD02_015060 [Eretmocerus hayati]
MDKCKECGCICKQCNRPDIKHSDMHLHVEIENLRRRLVEKDNHIVTMETHFLNEAEKYPNGEVASLKEEVLIWQDKYMRLYESHKRIQKINQNLEDKLLRIVDKCETEKGAFTKDIGTLTRRLADANNTIHQLTQDNEKYKNDVNLAIQLLQCKPSNFIGQKYESLSPEVQVKVKNYLAQKGRSSESSETEVKSITVPISTFPPTAMVYNIAKPVEKPEIVSDDESRPPVDVVSASIMAKVLEDRKKERIFSHHCNTCSCHKSILKIDNGTQTEVEENEGTGNTSNIRSHEVVNRDLRYFKSSKKSSSMHAREKNSRCDNRIDFLSTDDSVIRDTLVCVNEVADAKNFSKRGSSKLPIVGVSDTKNQIDVNSKQKLHKHLSLTNSQDGTATLQNSSSDSTKLSKDTRNLDNQAKIDLINERLWKSNWTNSISSLSSRGKEAQLDVINERVWKSSNSVAKADNFQLEKPLSKVTVIEVRSPDEQSEQTVESTTSPSFSGDSLLISSSDPPSSSSDAQPKRETKLTGPRSCLMRVNPGSNNILLDSVSTYETVLYTSGTSNSNTALVHVPKSTESVRSASVSSEESAAPAHLQRVAQWVDNVSTDRERQQQDQHQSVDERQSSPEEPMISAKKGARQTVDLMTFEGSSDEELRLTLDYECQANISEEMEETYAKLAADLETVGARRLPNPADLDLMTIEKYRREQKRLLRNSSDENNPRT